MANLNETPAGIKLAYLKGYRAAVSATCQKLEAQGFKINEQVEQVEDERNAEI